MSGIADVNRSIFLWGSKHYWGLWSGKGARGVHPPASVVRAGCFFSSVGVGVVSEVIPEELNFPRYQDLKFPKDPGFSTSSSVCMHFSGIQIQRKFQINQVKL